MVVKRFPTTFERFPINTEIIQSLLCVKINKYHFSNSNVTTYQAKAPVIVYTAMCYYSLYFQGIFCPIRL